MEEQLQKQLLRKQVLYTNIIYLFYLLVVLILIFVQASSVVVYSILGIVFLLSPVSIWFTKKPNPLLQLFPGMSALMNDERQRLGKVGRTYYLSGALLQLALSGFCFFQAFIRGEIPFTEGIPWWYVLVAALILFYLGNVSLRFHQKRLAQKSQEELVRYAKDQTLFSLIFLGVFLFFVIAGATLVFIFR